MTNVMTSYKAFLTPGGLTMLTVAPLVGAAPTAVVFSVVAGGFALLLDQRWISSP